MKLQEACRQLVERGRLGDQNALATMVQVHKNAGKGDPKAKAAHEIMLRYARATEDDKPGDVPSISGRFSSALAMLRDGIKKVKSPLEYVRHVRMNVPQVGVSIRDAANSAQAISKGPDITESTLQTVESTFTTDRAKEAFRAAEQACGNVRELTKSAASTNDPQDKNALQMGFVMGLARRMQIVRAGGPIAAYSKIAAWELGEQ